MYVCNREAVRRRYRLGHGWCSSSGGGCLAPSGFPGARGIRARCPPSPARLRSVRRTAASCARGELPRRTGGAARCAQSRRSSGGRTGGFRRRAEVSERLRASRRRGRCLPSAGRAAPAAQAEQLPAAQAETQGENVQGVEPVSGRGSQHGSCLGCREPSVHLVLGRGYLDELGDIARNGFLPDGTLQRVSEYGMD